MAYALDCRPKKGDIVLYDNGGRDIGEAGKVERVVKRNRTNDDGSMFVVVNGVERDVRFIATGDVGVVWCINGPIGPNQFANGRGFHVE